MGTKKKITALVSALLGCCAIFFAGPVGAFTQSESTQRVPVRWTSNSAPLVFEHTPTDITDEQSRLITAEVLANWNAVAPFQILESGFGRNRLRYSADSRFFGPGVVAVTVLSYDPGVGAVSEGEILLNQTTTRAFCLTADKAGTTCQNRDMTGGNRVFLGDVLAHEFGHFMGLGHSEVRESSMVFSTFKGQHSPHADDIAGARTVYGAPNFGKIMGTVMGGSAVPVFGAHVQAISTRSGAIAAGTISQEDGRFILSGLDLDDTYYLYVEPLRHLESLSDAYRSAKTEFCPAAYVGSFFEKCGSAGKGHPQPLSLTSTSPDLDVGVLTIRCQVRVGEDYMREKLSTGAGVYDFQASAAKPAQSFVGYFSSDDVLDTAFTSDVMSEEINLDFSGLSLPGGSQYELDVSVITTEFGSALDFSVEIQGAAGTIVDGDRSRNMFGETLVNRELGTQRSIFTRRIRYPLSSSSALNSVVLKLKPRALTANEVRDNLVLPDVFGLKARPWLVLTTIMRDGVPFFENRETILGDNLSCLDAPFTFAVRPNQVSAAALAGNAVAEENASTPSTSATCASWEPPAGGGGAGGMGAVATSLMLGVLVVLFPRLRRRS